MEFINTGAGPDDGTGDDGRDAFEKINRNTVAALIFAGLSGRETWGTMGDSMVGFSSTQDWKAIFAVIRMLYHDFNAIIDLNSYYEVETEVIKPAGQRGVSFGKGQTTVAHMRNVQLPFFLQAVEEGLPFSTVIMSPLQNDVFNNLAATNAILTDLLYVVDTVLSKGKRILMLGVYPQNEKVTNGLGNVYGKHYCERALTVAAENRKGFVYVPFLEVLKTGNPAEEAAGKINYRGPKGGIGGMTADDIHLADMGAYVTAPLVAPHVKRMVRAYHPPTFDAVPFDQARNPLGNIFGAAGRFAGSGGTITDLSKGASEAGRTTASNALPAGLEIRYDTTKGVTLTPSLTGDPDEPFEIRFDGIPTEASTLNLAILRSTASYSGLVEMWGQVRLIDWQGLSGLGAGQVELPDQVTVPFNCGMGSIGSPWRIIPGKRSQVVTLHSMQPAYYGNPYGQEGRLGISTALWPGADTTGSRIRFRRLGLFPVKVS